MREIHPIQKRAIFMKPMDNSGQVAEWGYDYNSRTFVIKFKSGGTYHYFDVPATVVQAFEAAKSPGGFLASDIKPNFKFEKQPEEIAPA